MVIPCPVIKANEKMPSCNSNRMKIGPETSVNRGVEVTPPGQKSRHAEILADSGGNTARMEKKVRYKYKVAVVHRI